MGSCSWDWSREGFRSQYSAPVCSPEDQKYLWFPDSASARRPSGSTMAPNSLLSAVAHQSTDSARLPRPSGAALVCRWPSFASGLHSSGSVRLLLPFGSFSVLCCSGSTAALQIPPVALAHQLSVSASSSSTTCSAVVGRPLGVCSPSSPCLLPPSTPPWFAVMAVTWVPPGTASFKPLLSLSSPPWFLPPSSPRFLTNDEESAEQPSSVRQCSRLLHVGVLGPII